METNLHPISEIFDSITLANEQCVRLTRTSAAIALANGTPREAPLAMMRKALEAPLDFPPVSAAVVPGDRVAIAVAEDVPCVGELVRGAVESFQAAGIDPESISVVTTDAETGRRCRKPFGDGRAMPQFVIHDADDKENLCIVGFSKRKEPFVVNRTIFDADFVLPIGSTRPGGGAYDSLFPKFSSAEAIANYRTPAHVSSPEDVARQAKEADEAGWQIGVMMAVQVVPGVHESVAHVVAGEPKAVARQCETLYDEQWSFRSPQQVSLVIANISGGPETQNWQNVGRALATAEPLLSEGGAIAICSNLAEPPGESMSRLMGANDLERAERKILRQHAPDSVPAWHAAQALRRGPVYFLSQLDSDTVEDLGFGYVESIDDLARLASRHESCILMDDSQRMIVKVD